MMDWLKSVAYHIDIEWQILINTIDLDRRYIIDGKPPSIKGRVG
jgi:hypothetical protein